MNKLIGATILSLCWTTGMSQPDDSDRFIGTWLLQYIESRSEAGEWVVSDLLGPDPLGILIYDEHQNMAAQLARRDRSIPDPEDSPAELVNGYVAYFGTYAVDSTAGTVSHHRSAHNNAELGHLTVVRFFEFDGDLLTLTVAPDREFRLIWKRAESAAAVDPRLETCELEEALDVQIRESRVRLAELRLSRTEQHPDVVRARQLLEDLERTALEDCVEQLQFVLE